MKKIILTAMLAFLAVAGSIAQAQTKPKTFPTATANAQDPTPGLTAATGRITNTMSLITLALSEGKITKAQAQPLWSQLQTAMQQLVSNVKANAIGQDLTSNQQTILKQILDSVNASIVPLPTPVATARTN